MSIDQDHIDDFMYRTFGYKKPLAKAESLPRPGGDAMIGRGPRSRPSGGARPTPGAEYERAGDADGRIRPPGGSGGSSGSTKPTKPTPYSTTPYSDKVQSTSSRKPTPYSTTPYSDKVRPKPTSGGGPKPGVAYMDPEGKVEAPEFRPPADGDRYDRGLNMDLGPTTGSGNPVHPYGSQREAEMAAKYRETGVIDNATERERRFAHVRRAADPHVEWDGKTGGRKTVTRDVTIGEMRRRFQDPDAVKIDQYARDGSDRKGTPT